MATGWPPPLLRLFYGARFTDLGPFRAITTTGLVALVASAAEGQKLSGEASNFANGMKSLSGTQLVTVGRKLAAGAWVAKESPGYLKGLYSSSKAALTFARAAKIKVPGNAESMLDSL